MQGNITDATIMCELTPILPLKDMHTSPLCTAVVVQVTNPRALAKMFAALHSKLKHPIKLSELDDNDESGNIAQGGEDDDGMVIRLLKYWGFAVVVEEGSPPSSLQTGATATPHEEWPPLPTLDHLKMVRKNFPTPSSSVSPSTEILLGVLPQCGSGGVLSVGDNVARRTGLFVCRHLQNVLLANVLPSTTPQPKPSAAKQQVTSSSAVAESSAAHPVVGKKTQRTPVNAGELEGVFAGVALTAVPLHSPIIRDNWDVANSVWPLTTPAPRPRHLSLTSNIKQESRNRTMELKPKTTTTPQSRSADEIFIQNAVDIVRRYRKDFMRMDTSVALVCKVDSGEVIAAVKMPVVGSGCKKGPMNPYCVDVDNSTTQCRLGQQFINHHSPTDSSENEEGNHQNSCEYDSQLTSTTPFFAHAAFEALRIASVTMYHRHKSKKESTPLTPPSTTTTVGGGGSGVEDYLCNGLDLICNIEPCNMCAMACVHSRLNRLVYLHRNVGGQGGVSGGITTPHEVDGVDGGGFRVHCCPTLNHHFTTYEMQFTEGATTKQSLAK